MVEMKKGIMHENCKKGLLMAALAVFSLGMMAGCSGGEKPAATDSGTLKIGVAQLMKHGALDAANEGFVQALADNGYVDGENIIIAQANAQGEQANLQTIAQQFISNDTDLICAIATPTAQVIAAATETIPIVGTAITDYIEADLVESNEAPGMNITGTSDLNPITDQVDLILQLVPEAKTIGIMYTSSEVNSQIQAAAVKEYAQTLNIDVVEVTISSVNDIAQAAQNLVNKVDVVYLPTDNNIASAIPQVVQITDEAGLVTVCGESSMVSAGGTATYGVNYYQLGYKTGEMAVKILKGEAAPATMPIVFANSEDLKVTINTNAVEALGITVADEVLEKAEKVTTVVE